MTRRAVLCGAVVSLLAAPAPAQEAEDRCAALTAETMAMMEAGPLMKDELATAVMWLRLDAEEAASAGDAARCVELMGTARGLLEGWRRGAAGRDQQEE